jgi:ubiquitin carboxyl-terminal hydrolase 2/21
MNATLQCLCHVSSLKDYFLDDNRYYQEVMTKPTARLTQSLAEVVRKLWSQTTETYYAPRNFKNIISQMNPLFQGIQANDSKDLVLFIFENIHNELNNPSQNPTDINLNNIRPELYQFRQNYYSQNYSTISQIFYYEQSSIMKCLNCGFETYNFNIMNMIIFPLEKVRLYLQKVNPQGFGAVTLYDCFDQNEQIEMLEGANQIYCNSCRQNSNATSSNKLYTCPEVLTIILNRGKGLEFEVEFSFPMTISIEKYITDKTCDPNYELIGVLTHHGPSGMAGHFVAYCKSPVNGQWYFYNDATVTQCSSNVESEMQSKGIPYILFYQRRKTKMEGNYESKCIYFTYEGKEGYYDYTDDNKMLYQVYSEFRSKYGWAPEGGRLMLTKNDNMLDLDEYKSLRENGINDKDKICIIKDAA